MTTIIVVVAVLCGTALFLLWWIRDIFDPVAIFLFFQAPFFILRPLILLFGLQSYSWPGRLAKPLDELILLGSVLFATGSCAFIAGYMFVGGHRRRSKTLAPLSGSQRKYATLAMLWWVLGVASYFYLLRSLGGLRFMLENMKMLPYLLSGKYTYLHVIHVALVLSTGWMVIAPKGHKTIPGIAFGSLLLLTATFGGRSEIVYPVLIAFIARHFYIQRLKLRQFVILAISIVIVLVVYKEIREPTISERVLEPTVIVSLMSRSLNLDQYDACLLLLDQWKPQDFRLGSTFVQSLVGVIPRRFWPEKPSVHVGIWFKEQFFGSLRGGVPITNIGEYYLNGGWIGVVLGMFLSGCVMGMLFRWISIRKRRFDECLIYAVSVLYIVPGGISSITLFKAIIWMVPLLGTFWLSRDALISRAQLHEKTA